MIEQINENVLHVVGYGITCDVDIDYDNPDLEKIKTIMLNDFSRKLMAIYNEHMYAMPNALFMYGIFDRRYLEDIRMSITNEYKKKVLYISDCDEVAKYVYDYFKKYYVGPTDMMPESPKTIRRWFSAGEFPFLWASLFRNKNGRISMGYMITR
jgi:hypothetical protein